MLKSYSKIKRITDDYSQLGEDDILLMTLLRIKLNNNEISMLRKISLKKNR